MRKEEVWSISIRRAEHFFRQQEDVTEETAGTFTFRACRVTLTELPPNGPGIWAVPRIQLRIEGEDADVEAIYRRFFLRFLSAGG